METYANVLVFAILYFTVLMLLEWLASALMKKEVYRAMDTISSLSSGLTNTIKDILKLGIVILSYDWMVNHWAFFEIQMSVWVFLFAFLYKDWVGYWTHRWNHKVNILWNRHIVHHSSEEFNLACALRQSISGIIGIYFFMYIPAALIGIPTKVIAIVAPLHLFAQFWYHTRLIGRMGFLEYFLVTPSHHRVHHAINKEYIDKNFAQVFIVWDRLFGTFQEEQKDIPPVYGVKKAVQTWNPVIINFMHLWQLIKDAWRTHSWKDKVRVWLTPTGWRPEDVKNKYPVSFTDDAFTQIKYKTSFTTGLKAWAWFQLLLHTAFQFHLIFYLTKLDYLTAVIYGLFIILSIFAYTTLMDRHKLAIPFEAIKMMVGFALLFQMKSWFLLDNVLPYASIIMMIYLTISMLLTIYYSYFDTSSKKEKVEMTLANA